MLLCLILSLNVLFIPSKALVFFFIYERYFLDLSHEWMDGRIHEEVKDQKEIESVLLQLFLKK